MFNEESACLQPVYTVMEVGSALRKSGKVEEDTKCKADEQPSETPLSLERPPMADWPLSSGLGYYQ